MTSSGQPRFATLLDWLEGRLDEVESAKVAAYVEHGDAAVHESVEWIREFLAAARVLPLEAPPAETSTRLRQLFTNFHGSGEPDSQAWLEYDTRMPETVSGVRSGATTERSHLVYGSDLGRLVLEVTHVGPGEVDLRGEVVLSSAAAGTGVELAFVRGGVPDRAARCARDGRFEVLGASDQIDAVWLTLGDVRVRAALDLRAH